MGVGAKILPQDISKYALRTSQEPDRPTAGSMVEHYELIFKDFSLKRGLPPDHPVTWGCLKGFPRFSHQALTNHRSYGSNEAQLMLRLSADPDITYMMLVLWACRL